MLAASASANTSGWFAHEEPELEVSTSVEGEETDLYLMGAINDNANEALVFAEKKDKKEKDDKKKKDKEKKKDKDDKKDKGSKSKKDKPTKKPTERKPDDSKSSKPTRKPTKRDSSSSKSTKRPTRKPTRKPTNRDSSSSSKSTKRPTRKPTRRPTRKPTRRPTGRRPTSSCIDDESPRTRHNGNRWRFHLLKSHAKCVDRKDRRYEYGQFDKVREFSQCADACVKDVRSSLLDSLRGYDWNCEKERCRCLYDKGTLDSRNSGNFDRTNRDERGDGPIEGATKSDDYFCAELEGNEFVGNADDSADEYSYDETSIARNL